MAKIILILVGLNLFAGVALSAEPKWQELSRGVFDVRAVLTHKDNAQVIYIGTGKGVFKTEDGGYTWRSILSLSGGNQGVNYLVVQEQDKNCIYAATAAGLFFSANSGQRWVRVFKGKNSFENESLTFAVFPDALYLGTKSGLFISKDNGRTWLKVSGRLGRCQIFNLAYSTQEPDYLYVACVDGLFKSLDRGQTWEKVFIGHTLEENSEEEKNGTEDGAEEKYSGIKYIAIDPHNPSCLYLATTSGVYRSQDKGVSWEALPEYGLLSRSVQFLLFSPQAGLYAATGSGIFFYRDRLWRELSFNLSANKINALGLDKSGDLYACTDKGLFRSRLDELGAVSPAGITAEYSRGEPGIADIQNQAIKYAEVDPQKIIRWRNQAQKKAILPQVSLDLGRNITDLWHWETGSSTKADDDSLRRGKDSLDWDITLSWDLSELIWNNDQTSIDTRSRLLVQLRGDILDEVNKLYFERIRVKMELDSLQIEDKKKRFERELRVQELTASLDALTGGYFSRQIKAGNG